MHHFLLENSAGIGPCMDIRTHNGHLCVIQNRSGYPDGRLCILTPEMEMISSYTGIGNARQIEISGNIAIITAREDGLWIFDLSETTPRLLSHYRTVEFATGAAVYANFALISCRQYGVEILDISDPSAPRHAGIIRIGEVQSACVYEGYLYGGIWGSMAVAIVDIRDMAHPRLLPPIPLEGRGDGVFVRDGILYAVTGQHRRGLKNTTDHSDPCFGIGNGLSVFDVSDPENPRQIHRQEFGKCYNIGLDTWKPALCGNTLISCCSTLGVFACDKFSFAPIFHAELPDCAGITDKTLPRMDGVMGFAALGKMLYVCGGRSDLYCCDTGMELGECDRWDTPQRFPSKTPALRTEDETGLSLRALYQPADGSPVLDLCECGSLYAAACASGGLRLLDETFTEIAVYPTETFCCDVEYSSGILAAALSEGGIQLYRLDGTTLHPLSRIETSPSALQIRLSEDGKTMFGALGGHLLVLYDLTDPDHPVLLEEKGGLPGPLYGDNFTRGMLKDGRLTGFGHRTGLLLADPTGEPKIRTVFYTKRTGFTGFGPESGCDTDGKNIFYTMGGGYVLLLSEDGICADDLTIYRPETPLRGKITLCGRYMVCTERAEGIVTVTDISDIRSPKTVGSLRTSASPGKTVFSRGRILIPGGYGGLLELSVL